MDSSTSSLARTDEVSTSKTVIYVWTFVFASALVIMTSMVVFGHLKPDEAFHTGSNWDAYLLLLGGPFASAVIAKGIVSYQTQQDPTSKSGTPATSGTANTMSTSVAAQPSPTDIVNGDSGTPSLVEPSTRSSRLSSSSTSSACLSPISRSTRQAL